MAKVVASRFALLRVEGEDDDDKKGNNSQKTTNGQSQNKKKNKKKKAHQADEELKKLAFGGGRPGSGRQKQHENKKKETLSEEQWEKWQENDAHFASEAYERDLQEALMQSRLEFEESQEVATGKKGEDCTFHSGLLQFYFDDSQTKKVLKDAGFSESQIQGKEEKKKKKQKDKPATMTLDQFNQMNSGKQNSIDEDTEEVPSPHIASATHTDPKFFDHLNDDVHKILQKEKIQEEYQKHFAVESVVMAKHQKEIDKKDKEIEFLRASVKKLEEEYKQVKKRNKQLCVILAQGEMKDKAEVLMQVDQLTQVKDELTEQVSELTAELEKERSKVHSLKSELDKYKGGKHGGK